MDNRIMMLYVRKDDRGRIICIFGGRGILPRVPKQYESPP